MLGNQAQACEAVALLVPGAKADTTAATGGWVAVAKYEGQIAFIQSIGTVTAGSIAGKIRHADDSGGTGAADVTGATFTSITTSNDPATEKIYVSASALKPYVQYLGTVTTGPADAGVVMVAHPKYVG